ncbi:MAG TPA: hypothetical protein VGB42_01670 [Candidatus Thermoplasmatota archaeon]
MSTAPHVQQLCNCAASVALYTWDSTVTSLTGAGRIYNPNGPNGDERPPVALATPEGYAVLQKEVGSSVNDIHLQVGPTQYERCVKDSDAPGGRVGPLDPCDATSSRTASLIGRLA